MKKSRLVSILRAFSKKEMKELKKWLLSPVHNQREDVVIFLDYLTKARHLEEDKYLEKEKVFHKVYTNEVYDDAKMRQVMHFLLKAVEEFLIYQDIIEDEVRAKSSLINIYWKRRLDKACEKAIKTVEQLQEKQKFRNGHFFRNEYLIQQERYNYLSGFKRIELNLQEMSDALDATYIADKLRQSALMLAHQNVYTADYEIGLLNEVLQYVEQRELLRIPPIAIYYYIYKTNNEKKVPEHFFNLKREIIENGRFFPKSEIRDIYLLTINYCINRMNAGFKNFLREAFELYKEGFDQKILITDNLISRWTFLNVVINGTLLKEFDWVENFVQNFEIYLEERYRENTVHYSLAKLYFEKGDYNASMRLLIQYEYDEILMNLNAKIMLLKMYYEQEEYDALESLIESMRAYIQRKKVMGYHRENFTNFLKMTKNLIKVNPYSKTEKEKLKTEIENVNPIIVTERKWLLEQLDAL